jgi:hypothetical protein
MSDTPRTDALLTDGQVQGPGAYRMVCFARELERECKHLEDALNRACDRITDLQRPVDPRQSQPKCLSCGGWVKVEEGGLCIPCYTEGGVLAERDACLADLRQCEQQLIASGAREQELAEALQLVLDDWANGNTIQGDAMDRAHAVLAMHVKGESS